LAGQSYRLKSADLAMDHSTPEEINGTKTTAARKLGPVQIGMFAESH
jgi:hypothetical protein